ncbi:Ig-like domain-containing protein [uncultured Williamsia sp.]|uniref:Ig-like domain-containing protein n=1 Tax=uncultured Williamsia sp. TaxID=259311 RepID=UPI00260965AC|nr:Ig-like domain-containing protein [uncultured Williamsia sp.]
MPVAATNQTTGLPVTPAPVVNPLGDLVAAFFRRIQSVFDPYRTNQNASTTINSTTGQVTGSAQFTSPFFLPQWYTITAPAGGTASIDKNGQFVYTPTATARHAAAAPGGATSDSFTVTANNAISKSSIVVTVPIVPINSAPVAGATTVGTPRADGAVSGSVSVTDRDNDPITYTASTPGKGSVVVSSTGGFTYTPTTTARHDAASTTAPTSAASDGFTITASDGHGGVTPISVVVPVLPANQAPVAGSTTVGTPGANGVVTGTVSTTDADSDTVTYTAGSGAGAPSRGSVVVTPAGGFTYTPASSAQHAAAAGGGATSDSFTVIASDGHGGSTPISVVVPIAPANQAPVVGTTTVGAPGVNGVVAGSVSATDADGDTVTYSAGNGSGAAPSRGTVVVTSSGGFTYTPAAGAGGSGSTSDTFTVIASDGHGGATPISVTVPIAADNQAPVAGITFANPPGTNGVVTGFVSATDPDGDPVTFSAPTTGLSAQGGAVVVDGAGTFTYTPTATVRHAASASSRYTDSFTITASDGRGGSTPITVTVAVSPVNAAPVAGMSSATVVSTVTGQVTGSIGATDADGDHLEFHAPSTGLTSGGGSITVSTDGTYSYVPTAAARHAASAPGGVGADSFVATVDDGHGGTTPITVTVPISPANQAPVVGTSTVNAAGANGAVTGSVSITDPDGDPLTYTSTSPVNGGSVVVNANGTFTYTPGAAAHSAAANGPTTDTFTISAGDGHGGVTTPISVTVPITPANQPPTAAPFTNGSTITGVTPDTNTVTGTITVTDADNDTLTYTAGTPARGSVTVNSDGSFTYIPTAAARHDAAATGNFSDTFTVTVSDSHGGSIPVTVTVPVSPINTSPVAGTTTVGTPNATTGVVTGAFSATDADGDALTWYQNGSPTNGSVTVDTDGTFTYTPTTDARTAAANGGATSDTVSVVVVDGHGGVTNVTATVPISAPAVNHSPILDATTFTPFASVGQVVTVTLHATDPDGDPITFSGPSRGALTADGRLTFIVTAADLVLGYAPIMAVATDNRGGITPISIFVPANPDRAPVAGQVTTNAPGAGGLVTGSVTATDPDGDPLTFTGPTGATTNGGSVTVTPTGGFTYAPSTTAQHAAAGGGPTTDSFYVNVTDGRGGSVAIPVTVTIAPANTAPTATVRAGSGPAGSVASASVTSGSVGFTIVGNDADGDAITFSVPSGGTPRGTVSQVGGSSGSFVYTPTVFSRMAASTQSVLTDTFTVTMTDGHGGSTPLQFTVPIIGVQTTTTMFLSVVVTNGMTTIVATPQFIPPPPPITTPPTTTPPTTGGSGGTGGGGNNFYCEDDGHGGIYCPVR